LVSQGYTQVEGLDDFDKTFAPVARLEAIRAWYERLKDFLVSKGFKIGKVDTTLFTKKIKNDLSICQIYVDYIIFGSTN
jgi:hypothetical protein